jgi:hypothetical protein
VSDANTGGLLNAGTVLYGRRSGANNSTTEVRSDFGSADAPASHPVARRGDQYVALDRTSAGNADIQTISFP